MNLNQITLMGRLCAAPELKNSQYGDSCYLKISIACDRMPDRNGNKETDFISCVFFGRTAEHVEKYFAKGDLICLTGRLQSSKYKDRDGNNRTSWDVIADRVYFCHGKLQSDDATNRETRYNNQQSPRQPAPPPRQYAADDGNWPPPPIPAYQNPNWEQQPSEQQTLPEVSDFSELTDDNVPF